MAGARARKREKALKRAKKDAEFRALGLFLGLNLTELVD